MFNTIEEYFRWLSYMPSLKHSIYPKHMQQALSQKLLFWLFIVWCRFRLFAVLWIIFNRRMQTQNVEIRYRSIKYSTSQSSLSKQKTENSEPLWKSRLSVNKENRISENGLMHRTQTSKGIRITPVQNRGLGNRPTSSLYKLRIVANSSHIRTRAS